MRTVFLNALTRPQFGMLESTLRRPAFGGDQVIFQISYWAVSAVIFINIEHNTQFNLSNLSNVLGKQGIVLDPLTSVEQGNTLYHLPVGRSSVEGS